MANSIIALIPARSGSKRLPNKNVRPLAVLPLLVWTIKAAQESGVFHHTAILVSSDSEDYGKIAVEYGASWIRRKAEDATDNSPDVEWVKNVIDWPASPYDAFAILRPTSPFRTADTIRRAWAAFQQEPNSWASLRAVEPVKQHPNKMWVASGGGIIPYNAQNIIINGKSYPAHSVPSQLLPQTFVQNASLEIAWTKTLKTGTISGNRILPFRTEGYEGFDLNTPEDWILAEALIARGLTPIRDPVLEALYNAPIDDEPETEEERVAVNEAREDIKAGRVVTLGPLNQHEVALQPPKKTTRQARRKRVSA